MGFLRSNAPQDSLGELTCSDPAQVNLSRDERGQLVFRGPDGAAVPKVRIARCFPWSLPDQYLSILDGEGVEVALLRSVQGLDPATRAIIDAELAAQEFLPRITRVLAVDDKFDVMAWSVDTDRGPIELQVQHAEDVRALDDGRIIIRDHAGGTFLIPDLAALDLRSRRLVEDHLG